MHNNLLAGIVSKYRLIGRTIITALIFSALLTVLTGCGHEHKWTEATCTEPKKCTECGKTEGEPLGHKWKEATCTEAKHGSQDLQCLRRDRRRTSGTQMEGSDVHGSQNLQCLRRNRGRAVRPCRRGLGSHKRADLH